MDVLLIEGDPKLRRVMERKLRKRGYEVTSCQDPESGFEAFKEKF